MNGKLFLTLDQAFDIGVNTTPYVLDDVNRYRHINITVLQRSAVSRKHPSCTFCGLNLLKTCTKDDAQAARNAQPCYSRRPQVEAIGIFDLTDPLNQYLITGKRRTAHACGFLTTDLRLEAVLTAIHKILSRGVDFSVILVDRRMDGLDSKTVILAGFRWIGLV